MDVFSAFFIFGWTFFHVRFFLVDLFSVGHFSVDVFSVDVISVDLFSYNRIGLYGERRARSYITEVLGLCLRRGPRAKPLVRGLGGKAPEAKHFLCSDMPEMAQLSDYVYEVFYAGT